MTWVFLNQIIDYEEKTSTVHARCMHEWKQVSCPVCGKPSKAISEYGLDEDIAKEIYRPSEDGAYPSEELSDEEADKRRREIQELFASGEMEGIVSE